MTASARRATAAILVLFAAAAVWNAARYPPTFGYDADHHIAYAEGLVERGELPDETGEYYTPPLFYALAGAATELGERVGLGEPRHLAQLLNAALAVGTALLLLALARTVWPGRTAVHVAALGLFAFGAIVLKAAAMYHPETLDLFLSTLALLLAARMLVRRSYSLAAAAALGAALGAGQLVRAFSLWTFAVVLLTLAAVALADRELRRPVLRAALATVAATALVAGPWYAYQASRYTNPVFDRPQPADPLWERRPASFYLDPGLPDVISRPYRPSFVNRFAPTVYAEGWGDYFGVWAWNAAQEDPDGATRAELVGQSVVGIAPTLLMVAGWLALLASAARRVRERPELLLVALLPLAGLAGLLYFAVSYPTPDGDVIKATYMLTTVPAWALCFGVAVDRLARRRSVAIGLAIVLVASAAVSLRFAVYGAPLG